MDVYARACTCVNACTRARVRTGADKARTREPSRSPTRVREHASVRMRAGSASIALRLCALKASVRSKRSATAVLAAM
eukprot:5542798-Pleurochrysis_carterae.AAC.2